MAKRNERRRASTLLIALAATVAALAPTQAAATVYEVGNDGIAHVQQSGRSDVPENSTGAAPEPAPLVPQEAITTVEEPNVPASFRESVLAAATGSDVSPHLLAALATQESRWRASAVSPKGAVGLTQLMPATARALAVDPRNPAANLAGGARYLRQMIDRFDGNIERALAAYNAGPGRVMRTSGLPAISETRTYVATIVDGLGGAALSERRK